VADEHEAQLKLSEKDLRQWDLLAAFRKALARRALARELHPSWSDPRRESGYADYLSLFLSYLSGLLPSRECSHALSLCLLRGRLQSLGFWHATG
jgi:hypothetical protein